MLAAVWGQVAQKVIYDEPACEKPEYALLWNHL